MDQISSGSIGILHCITNWSHVPWSEQAGHHKQCVSQVYHKTHSANQFLGEISFYQKWLDFLIVFPIQFVHKKFCLCWDQHAVPSWHSQISVSIISVGNLLSINIVNQLKKNQLASAFFMLFYVAPCCMHFSYVLQYRSFWIKKKAPSEVSIHLALLKLQLKHLLLTSKPRRKKYLRREIWYVVTAHTVGPIT